MHKFPANNKIVTGLFFMFVCRWMAKDCEILMYVDKKMANNAMMLQCSVIHNLIGQREPCKDIYKPSRALWSCSNVWRIFGNKQESLNRLRHRIVDVMI